MATIFGRRRYLNDISSHNAVARGLAERNAVNAPIQGSAADIMKIAMIDVHRRFAAEGIRSRVILQVHDELVVDMLRAEQEQVVRIVTESMESAARLKVRLVADAGVGMDEGTAARLFDDRSARPDANSPQGGGAGVAMHNISERIHRFYGPHSYTRDESAPGKGTKVLLHLDLSESIFDIQE